MRENITVRNNKAKAFAELLLFLFLLICFSCTENKSVIEGKVPNASYDKEVVYLVPIKDASSKTVDSAVIRTGRFRFEIKPEKQNQIFILRVKPILRLDLQDLLVISEPGAVYVDLNKNSSASGTPLNTVLQQWKEKKFVYDSIYYSINRQYKNETDESEKVRLQSESEKIIKDYKTYEAGLVEKNKDNPVGQFIRSLHQP